ncbi:MAG: 50S ribosomal protein L17 [Phycisphaerae bacterium]
MSRDSEHRVAMRRNLVSSLFEHERVSTTMEKAKDVKPFAEKLITLAKKGNLAARRRAISMLGNRNIVVEEEGELVKKGTVIGKLFSEIGPRYLDRPGGYTRIVRLAMRRLGDNGQLVLLQLIGKDEVSSKESKKKSTKKQKNWQKEQAVEASSAESSDEPEVKAAKGDKETQSQ